MCVMRTVRRPPERGQISHSDPLALSVGVADTKLNCAVKGATLLQLISLSADAHNGLHGISDPARAGLLVLD